MAMAVDEAAALILDAIPALQPIELPLAEAYGCVAAAEVTTEYDIPPFSAAEADGFAARSADIVAAAPGSPVSLRLVGRSVRGRPPEVTVGWGEAVRIAAGAPMPAGADCVVPAESGTAEGETAVVTSPTGQGANVSMAGEDVKAGSTLVPVGRRLSAPELGLLATAGHGSVPAYPRLRVGVLAVGDLVEPGRPTAFGQVRDAVSYLLLGALRDLGAVPYRVGIVPDANLREAVMSNTLRVDAFVVAGGLRGGSGLEALGAVADLRSIEVAVHPGSTVAFGTVEGRPFFWVSDKPMSAFVSFELFVRPGILRMMGRRDMKRPEVAAVLDEPVAGPPGLALFVPARMAHRDGAWHARPTGPAVESHLGSLAVANALAALPPGGSAGGEVRVRVLRPLER
ncbi:MAG: molybdopterin molybdotransferase MoeA [Actinomycetota bacterium]